MGNFLLSSSIGKKLIMSISGCFLILFIIFHLAMNLTAVFDEDTYNMIAAFLGANWYALIGTAILGAGVLIHILFAVLLTWQNYRSRGQGIMPVNMKDAAERKFRRYAVSKRSEGVTWSSKNMFVLGIVVACGLLLHLYNFWYNMQFQEVIGNHVNQFGHSPKDGAVLIRKLFASPVWCVIYIVWLMALWFHLTHGFWSMFQSVGCGNKKWYPRLKMISVIFISLIILGFISIVVVFYLKSIGIVIFG